MAQLTRGMMTTPFMTVVNGSLRTQSTRIWNVWSLKPASLNLMSIWCRLSETCYQLALRYHELTGSHLQVYGDLGELYGAINHGLKLHRNYAQDSDAKIGNHFVEVKTITPFKTKDTITRNLERNFSKVLIVKIDADFEVRSKLIDRKLLPKVTGKKLTLKWDNLTAQ